MKSTIIKIAWGIILIALGGISLASRVGYFDVESISTQMWSDIFAGFSVAFFVSYFIDGIRQWGWLFPALIFAALAITIRTITGNSDSPIIATAILLSVGLPFYVGYMVDRRHWGLLIPAWILTVISIIPVVEERMDSNIVGTLLLVGIAAPFLAVYLFNRSRKWALITATSLAVIGAMPLVQYLPNGDLEGPIVMLLFVLPFLVTFFLSVKNWWALIPAGFFASVGLVALLNSIFPDATSIHFGPIVLGIYTGVLFLGIAITFGILWLLRASRPTAWAIYPAIGCVIFAILASLFSQKYEDFLPALALLIIGGAMIFGSLIKQRGNKPAGTSQEPLPPA